MEVMSLKNITKEYGKKDNKLKALDNISIDIQKGDMIAIIGPSGSGKSTLLNILGMIDKPTAGKYYFKGEDVAKFKDSKLAKIRNESLGFVLQYFGLIDDYNIYQNVQIPLKYSSRKNKDYKTKIINVLEKLEIKDKLKSYPTELSGGQQQRVAIARAMINDPEIILADEPTGALDKKTGNEILDYLEHLNNQGKTIIIITHDENIAKRCKKIIRIEDGKML